jgi:hypothetical protein
MTAHIHSNLRSAAQESDRMVGYSVDFIYQISYYGSRSKLIVLLVKVLIPYI